MADKRSLVLIPCCSEKHVSIGLLEAEPAIFGIEPLRCGLQAKLQETPELVSKRENRDGLLNKEASMTPSYLLYQGRLFRPLSGLWDQHIVQILIVSAAYGRIMLGIRIPAYSESFLEGLCSGVKIPTTHASNQLQAKATGRNSMQRLAPIASL